MVDVVFAAVALTSRGTGLYGKVVIDPARPVCEAGQTCSAPDANDVLTFARRGVRPIRTRTHANGSYRIALRAGRYSVTARHGGSIGRGLEPRRVVVRRGRYARADFTLDVGIR